MKPGYYTFTDYNRSGPVFETEVYKITGTQAGNAFYNLWADKPHWVRIAQQYLPSEKELASARYSETDPVPELEKATSK
jgi:hypothetical protein